MATKKSTTTNAAKKTASKKTANKAAGQPAQGTRVVCPVCGSEFDVLAEHEHQVKNAMVIGADSGLGTIELPVSKRGKALKAAGVDTTKYFSINLPTGGSQWMKMQDGVPVAVAADDPVISQILSQGTVPNPKLFRRWVMSQVFHGLTLDGGFIQWMHNHGYKYQWKMIIDEFEVQAKLYGKDMENFKARNRWFDTDLAVAMADDLCNKIRAEAKAAKVHKCHGVPYVTIGYEDYFVDDIEKKLIGQLTPYVRLIACAGDPKKLYERVRDFWSAACRLTKFPSKVYTQSLRWVDAYKGMGAYATMQNLLRFHGCTFPKSSEFYRHNMSDLDMLELAAKTYEHGGGWRLFGLLKLMLKENAVDIKAKRAQWAAAKQAKSA